nr:NTP transferase domain-containing protein [Propionibacterium sp.]
MAASKPRCEASGFVLGLVLAAGAGRRMGGPKALIGPLATPDAIPLARVCAWVHEAGCPQVIAVVGAEAPRVRAELAPQPWLALAEASDWNTGMGASLRAGLAAARRTAATAALVTLVDLPDVRTAICAHVLAACGADPGTLGRAAYRGRPGHPVVIGRDHWDAVAAAAVGDRGARDYFARTPHRLVECGHLGTGADADEPDPPTA